MDEFLTAELISKNLTKQIEFYEDKLHWAESKESIAFFEQKLNFLIPLEQIFSDFGDELFEVKDADN